MTPGNPWFLAVLLAVVGAEAVRFLFKALTLSRLGAPVPANVADLFDAEAYARSQGYTRAQIRVDLVELSVSLAALLAFWLAGGFAWLSGTLAATGWPPLVQGLAGWAALYVAATLLSLPFSLWDTFVVEARWGFNRTTPATFLLDRVKGLALAAGLGLPLAAAVLWIFANVPHAWLWAWLLVTAGSLVVTFVAPRWIFPLFFKFTPLEEGELSHAIRALAARCDYPVAGVDVIDGSRRSSKANAFFAGFGKMRRIALFDTLLQKHTTPEIEAVLAHEIGHAKCRHVPVMLAFGTVQTGVMLFAADWAVRSDGLASAFGLPAASLWLGFVFFGLLTRPLGLVLGALGSALSRKHEYEADAFARRATGSPAPLAEALRRLSRDSLTNLTPHPWVVASTYSHPPLSPRLAALEAAP